MSKKKNPMDRNVLLDQPIYIQNMYKEWDDLAENMGKLKGLMKSPAFSKFSNKKKKLIRMQYKYMEKHFYFLDKRIILEILG